MALDLGLAAEGVEGGGGHDARRAGVLGAADVLDDPFRLRVDDTRQDGDSPVDDAEGLGEDLVAPRVGGEGDLSRRPGHEEPVDTGVDHAVDVALQGGGVERPVLERDGERRNDAADL